MMERFEIVPFGIYHVSGIADIERLVFSEPWSEQGIYRTGSDKNSHFIVAESGAAVVGYAGMVTVLDEGYIANVAVHPDWRRRGVARALLRELAGFGSRERLSFITLEVRSSNRAAIELYTSEGYVSEGMRPGYYNLPREDAIIMTLRLCSDVSR